MRKQIIISSLGLSFLITGCSLSELGLSNNTDFSYSKSLDKEVYLEINKFKKENEIKKNNNNKKYISKKIINTKDIKKENHNKNVASKKEFLKNTTKHSEIKIKERTKSKATDNKNVIKLVEKNKKEIIKNNKKLSLKNTNSSLKLAGNVVKDILKHKEIFKEEFIHSYIKHVEADIKHKIISFKIIMLYNPEKAHKIIELKFKKILKEKKIPKKKQPFYAFGYFQQQIATVYSRGKYYSLKKAIEIIKELNKKYSLFKKGYGIKFSIVEKMILNDDGKIRTPTVRTVNYYIFDNKDLEKKVKKDLEKIRRDMLKFSSGNLEFKTKIKLPTIKISYTNTKEIKTK